MMERLGDAFRSLDRGGALKGKLTEARALGLWDEVVGETIASNARAYKIQRGILYVRAKSPAWAQELSGLSAGIKKRINAAVGDELVKEIRFVQRGLAQEGDEPPAAEAPQLAGITLSAEEERAIRQAAAHVPEDELREGLVRLATKSKQLEKWRRRSGADG